MAEAIEQRTGLAAGLALALAVAGYALAVTGSPGWGLLSHLGAGALGGLGLLMSASPRVGGGLLSVVALVGALFGVGLDVFVWVGMLVF